ERLAAIEHSDVGTHHDSRYSDRARPQIVEHAQHHSFAGDVDPCFLTRLADGRFLQRRITALFPSARKGDLSAPRIAGVLRPLDEEKLGRSIIARSKDERHRRTSNAG